MRCLMFKNIALFFCLLSCSIQVFAEEKHSEKSVYDKPLMERYVLDELKSVRQDLQDLERRLIIEITDRELKVANRSLTYSSDTVTYFFYIIAGVASLIAFIGWQSLQDIKTKTKKVANKQIQEISLQFEKDFKKLSAELRKKTRYLSDTHQEMEKITEIHNLWLRAKNSQTPEQAIEIYDEILMLNPGDLETLTAKADSAMEIKEFNWALSICNRVLEVDEHNVNALYQRACAYACLGSEVRAIDNLELAIIKHSALKEVAAEEPDLENLHSFERFQELVSSDLSSINADNRV